MCAVSNCLAQRHTRLRAAGCKVIAKTLAERSRAFLGGGALTPVQVKATARERLLASSCFEALSVVGYGVAKPIKLPVCGLLAPLSVKVIEPARFAPRGDRPFVNRTTTVHVAPGASAVPLQLS